uniref:Uncharacterized protein n=1 Tax=Arundo donax TaxID=35708 RepID=A0A0A9H7N1_ARUDO
MQGHQVHEALEPNTLLKIVDVKGADGNAALVPFVVQEIVKPEGYNMMRPGSVTCKMNAGTLRLRCRMKKAWPSDYLQTRS